MTCRVLSFSIHSTALSFTDYFLHPLLLNHWNAKEKVLKTNDYYLRYVLPLIYTFTFLIDQREQLYCSPLHSTARNTRVLFSWSSSAKGTITARPLRTRVTRLLPVLSSFLFFLSLSLSLSLSSLVYAFNSLHACKWRDSWKRWTRGKYEDRATCLRTGDDPSKANHSTTSELTNEILTNLPCRGVHLRQSQLNVLGKHRVPARQPRCVT